MRKLPPHLKPYVSEQHYERYTPIDHAVWRYVMRQNRHALQDRAHDAYRNGLAQSGIGTERIPRVSEMNACLAQIGWGAVIVNGLIPGPVFYELLANGVLPIAAEIRKLTNLEYTPAPDIIHEAAGHAPILFDPEYRAYVRQIGAIGTRAFSVKEKQDAFDALRRLTIVMEDPASTAEEKAAAQQAVEEKQKATSGMTEAEMVSRLFWTTAEYGLIGDLQDPKIYGAGLLSSVGESKHCYTEAVAKIPYSVESCTEHPKVVTQMQTRLFVCGSFEELKAGAEALANTMAYRIGGTESLERAQRSKMIATFTYNSGLSVTGIVHALIKDDQGEAVYVNTIGETALTVEKQPLGGHGKDVHAKGFGSPIGLLQGKLALDACDDQALAQLGVIPGNHADLRFESGIHVTGRLKRIIRNEQQVVLLSFEDCTVLWDGRELYKKEWGAYDMAVGSRIVAAYPGEADPASVSVTEEEPDPVQESEAEAIMELGLELLMEAPVPLSELERLYQHVAVIREKNMNNITEESIRELDGIYRVLCGSYPNDWLLRLELLELAGTIPIPDLVQMSIALKDELHALSQVDSLANVINNGLAIL
ncbi:aromatic amino acid hydroxylase [Paenibacillus rhizovicinus]|uniref:Aromatic amino acid hydroxylase n=1 Tax=Paenibacillus rhizovicinus TaxID=2704463 RepID=A0A6C0P8F3_9BACL|nr:aromatic amino acid hydroxylase [Paenibacillus rhizovicinus]QHW34828.1 aromatic amino acid hydroxylase [Paenibacillus rhizovicinus]